MARFLFVTIPEKGHLHPMLGPAHHLAAAGHEIFWHAAGNLHEPLRRAGFTRFLPLAEPLRIDPPPKSGREFAEKLADGPWLRAWIRHLLLDTVADHVRQLEAICRAVKPQVVVADPMVYAAVIVAERLSLPWVAMSNSLNPVLPEPGSPPDDPLRSELLDTVAWLAPARDALFAGYGLNCRFRGCDALSPHLTLAFTTRELVGHEVPGVALVGPSLLPKGCGRGDEPAGWAAPRRQPSRQLVLVSFGSQIYYQPARFRSVVEAVRDLPLDLFLSVGDLPPAAIADPLPANVVAAPYLPQLELLAEAALLISHGGANSVMEALAAGVPLLLCPLCNDQYHQAYFLRRAQVGGRLDLPATVADCRQAIASMLQPGNPARLRHEQVVASYRRQDGALKAAELCARLG